MQEFELTKKIGYFTLDNAANNDTALVFLSKCLQELGVYFDPIEHCLQCIGHVINLMVKAFLYIANLGVIGRCEKDGKDDLWNWRVRGPYGRLRNMIT